MGIVDWLLVLLVAPGLLVLITVVVVALFRPRAPGEGPGYYHILGFDKTTQARRELTVQAGSRESARGRAEMDGIVVTEINQVNES